MSEKTSKTGLYFVLAIMVLVLVAYFHQIGQTTDAERRSDQVSRQLKVANMEIAELETNLATAGLEKEVLEGYLYCFGSEECKPKECCECLGGAESCFRGYRSSNQCNTWCQFVDAEKVCEPARKRWRGRGLVKNRSHHRNSGTKEGNGGFPTVLATASVGGVEKIRLPAEEVVLTDQDIANIHGEIDARFQEEGLPLIKLDPAKTRKFVTHVPAGTIQLEAH